VTYSTGERQRIFTKKIGYIASRDSYCELISDLPRAQCDALVDLYISTDGDHWNWNNNWFGSGDTSPETVCDNRYGVSCYDDNGALYVSYVSLSENNLSGALPESIGNLT